MKCPSCDNGKMKISITHMFSNKPAEECFIDCVICDGTGIIGERERRMIEYEKQMWCRCKEPGRSIYHKDNERGAAIRKHHYTCSKCGKVTQIG